MTFGWDYPPGGDYCYKTTEVYHCKNCQYEWETKVIWELGTSYPSNDICFFCKKEGYPGELTDEELEEEEENE